MRINSPQFNLMYKACMKASKVLIRDFGEIEKLQVLEKGPGDFVTASDKRVEKIIMKELEKSEYSILSEETGVVEGKDKDKRKHMKKYYKTKQEKQNRENSKTLSTKPGKT